MCIATLADNWKHGQTAMRIIKTRLCEMVPGLQVFLDVDNLGGGKDFPHVDVSSVVLCFLTQNWLTNLDLFSKHIS